MIPHWLGLLVWNSSYWKCRRRSRQTKNQMKGIVLRDLLILKFHTSSRIDLLLVWWRFDTHILNNLIWFLVFSITILLHGLTTSFTEPDIKICYQLWSSFHDTETISTYNMLNEMISKFGFKQLHPWTATFCFLIPKTVKEQNVASNS